MTQKSLHRKNPETGEWEDVIVPLSAAEEVDEAQKAVSHQAKMAALAANKYKRDRSAAYPSIGDQLDVVWKQMIQDRLGGKNLIQEADDLIGAPGVDETILGIKAKFPKPD